MGVGRGESKGIHSGGPKCVELGGGVSALSCGCSDIVENNIWMASSNWSVGFMDETTRHHPSTSQKFPLQNSQGVVHTHSLQRFHTFTLPPPPSLLLVLFF